MGVKRRAKYDRKKTFDSLVKNAFDFLRSAVANLERDPKESVIKFYAAVELFLKARLLLEHWTLVCENPAKADLGEFLAGGSRSVSMDEAVGRLQRVARVPVSGAGADCFKALRDHRNRLMHFYHPAYSGPPDKAVIREVVAEQCRAWIHLHRWLTHDWRAEFAPYQDTVAQLDGTMKKQRQFLKVVFEGLQGDIEKGKERGIVFTECFACGNPACRKTTEREPLAQLECLVCECVDTCLELPCPECGTPVRLSPGEADEGVSCDSCGKKIDMDYLIDKYGEHKLPKDEMIDPSNAYCGNCQYGGRQTVVPLGDDHLCLDCLALFDSLDQCDYCGSKVAGLSEDSHWSGCAVCEGVQYRD